MTNETATLPVMRLDDRIVGSRPEGKARWLGRTTLWSLITAMVASMVLSTLAPDATPGWASIPIGLMFIASMGLTVLSSLVQLWCWITPKSRGSLSLDATGVRVRGPFGERAIAKDRIEAGWLLRHGHEGEVELQLRDGDVVSTSVRSPAEAMAVLDAAGVDASKRALTMRLGSAATNLGIALLALMPGSCLASLIMLSVVKLVALPSAAAGFLLFALMALSIPLALRLFAPPKVQVGNDGVSVQGGFKTWFLPFEQIASVEVRASDLALQLRDGSLRTIFALGTGGPRLRSLAERINAGIADTFGPRDLSARLTALDRNGRSLEAWTAALRDLVNYRDDYRHTGLSRDEIEAALDDPHASVDRRIGAAFALSQSDQPAASARVRVIVEGIANEPAREALTRAADGALDEVAVTAATESSRVRVG